jgi:aspartate kinase
LTATNIIKANKNSLQYDDVLVDSNIAKVSLVGVGMRTHAGIASEAFKALAENDVNIQMISTSEIKITIVINEVNTDKAVKCLHETFDLDK